MAIDPLITAAGIGAASNLAGGFLGQSSAASAANKAWQRQKYLIEYGPQMMVQAAKRANVHPLTVFGINPASGPAPARTGDYGLSAAGQSIENALSRIKTPEQKAAELAQIKLLDKQADYYEALAEREKNRPDPSAPKTMGGGPFGPYGVLDNSANQASRLNQAYEIQKKPASVSRGIQGPIGPFYDANIAPDNYVWLTPREGVQDAVTEGFYDQGRYVMSRIKGHWGAARANKEEIRTLSRIKSDIIKSHPPARGYDYQYDTLRGQFKLVKLKRDQKSSLFINQPKRYKKIFGKSSVGWRKRQW